MRAAVALGANMGDRLENVRRARQALETLAKVRPPLRASAIYETEPVGCEEGAARFLNAVIEFEYAGTAHELLRELQEIERQLGRPAAHARNISRTIDLDILYFGSERIAAPDLQVPHARMSTRRFVLVPLAELRPELIVPGQGETVATLLARLPSGPAVVRLEIEW
jgi:2-amino-4-hydroxy-6-hydroxymethyldihydropteridine diphosphokinase